MADRRRRWSPIHIVLLSRTALWQKETACLDDGWAQSAAMMMMMMQALLSGRGCCCVALIHGKQNFISRAVAVRASLVWRLEEEEAAMVLLENARKWSKI